MGLSDDQRAMLRMVAQRGEQGYEDIAALMGLSVDEVRAKVAAALAELDSEGALSGDATEAEPATAAPAEKPEPAAAAPEPAEEPKQEPAAAPSPPPQQAAPRRKRPGPPQISLSSTGMRAAIGAAIAVIALVAVIVIVTGGGDEEPSSATAASGTAKTSETAASKEGEGAEEGSSQLTKAQLTAVDGSEAEGVAIFGRVKKSLALELAAEGLQKTGKSDAYTIWLSKNKQKMLPLASTKAPKGTIAAKFKVPVEVLAYLADETFTDLVLTRTDDSQLTQSLKAAAKQKTTPDYTGTEVLRGEVTGPIVGAQFQLEQLEAEEKAAEKKGE